MVIQTDIQSSQSQDSHLNKKIAFKILEGTFMGMVSGSLLGEAAKYTTLLVLSRGKIGQWQHLSSEVETATNIYRALSAGVGAAVGGIRSYEELVKRSSNSKSTLEQF